jgi:serine/threonine protein kinase
LLGLLRKCPVIDQLQLEALVEELQAADRLPTEPSQLASLLVKQGIITLFQAGRFLVGRTRGLHIGQYKILERLGQGGTGNVYLCEHPRVRRGVAVKVLPPHKAEQPSVLARFYREARAVAALHHPNLIRAEDVDQGGAEHFLVMEYVDGTHLGTIVKKFGPMDVARACNYVRQAALGLDHMHRAGLVHRDIKPANLLLNRQGMIKILDLGLARFFNDEEDVITRKHDSQAVLGTADYLSPEQARDSHDVDVRTDIYSLGATFYFLLTGRPPFPDGTLGQKLIYHQVKEPKLVRELRPEVPEGLAAVLAKMMAKEPAERYQTPAEVVDALKPWSQAPVGRPSSKEMPFLSAAARAVVYGQIPSAVKARIAAGTSDTEVLKASALETQTGATPQPAKVVAVLPPPGGGGPSPTEKANGNGLAVADETPSTIVGKVTKENRRPVLGDKKTPTPAASSAKSRAAGAKATAPKVPALPVPGTNPSGGIPRQWLLCAGLAGAVLSVLGFGCGLVWVVSRLISAP